MNRFNVKYKVFVDGDDKPHQSALEVKASNKYKAARYAKFLIHRQVQKQLPSSQYALSVEQAVLCN